MCVSVVGACAAVMVVSAQERVIRAGDVLPGIVVEESDKDPDLEVIDANPADRDENRRAVNRPPRVLKTVASEYPEELRGSGVTGEVLVSLMVDRLGRPSHIRVDQSPDELFTDSALTSLAQWEFLPALRNGRLTNSRVRVSIAVGEEMGDSTYFRYPGGRIVLEGVTYAGRHEHEIKRVYGLRPVYPFAMLADAKPGEVVLEFSVHSDGRPYDMQVVEATHRDFALAARAAMAHWRYSPALQEGNAVAARLRYRVSFQPDQLRPDVLELARRIQAGTTEEDFVPTKMLDSAPKVLRSMMPVLPEGAVSTEGRNRVTVGIVITPSGEVLLPRIEGNPDPLVGYAAATVVPYWKFSPAYRRGGPVQVDVSLPITF
jgi:TonB family protein